jgi:hypothetical protein
MTRSRSHSSIAATARRQRILAVVLALLGGGCGGRGTPGEPQSRDGAADVGDSATDRQGDAGVTCPVPQKAPSFARDVLPLLDADCNGCHSTHPCDGGFAPIAQNFETYAGFKPWATEALASMRRGGMPPPETAPPVSAADICMLQAWIDGGAEDN